MFDVALCDGRQCGSERCARFGCETPRVLRCRALFQQVRSSQPGVSTVFTFQYLGKTHNLWHRSVLMLETLAFENGLSTQLVKAKPTLSEYEFEPKEAPQQVCHHPPLID